MASRRSFLKLSAVGAATLAIPPTMMLEGCSTTWVQTVLDDLPTVINIVGSVASVVSVATGNGALAPEISGVVSLAVSALTTSLNTLQDCVNAYNTAKSQGTLAAVIAAVQAAQADAQKVVAALPAGIVSTGTLTIIVASIGTVITLLSSIQLLIPGATAATLTAKSVAPTSKVIVPNAAALKAGYNAVLLTHGYNQLQLK